MDQTSLFGLLPLYRLGWNGSSDSGFIRYEYGHHWMLRIWLMTLSDFYGSVCALM